MRIHHFRGTAVECCSNDLDHLPADGYVWIDFTREEAQGWEQWPQKLLDCTVEQQHVEDSAVPQRSSFFDGTSQYDMLIFEGFGPDASPFPFRTRSAAFFMFSRLLITVRAADSVSFQQVQQKLGCGRLRPPSDVLGLAHLVLDAMLDRFLNIREPLDTRLTAMQDHLLDPDNRSEDWRQLLDGRRIARRLEQLADDQLEALDAWRRGTAYEWSEAMCVRVRDLVDHATRVRNHAAGLERDLESAVQLHFTTLAHRSNEIMKVFTVMSVVFMPLSLLTGIWGMNFEDMPELHWRYGYPAALGVIVLLGLAMLLWFRRRKFF